MRIPLTPGGLPTGGLQSTPTPDVHIHLHQQQTQLTAADANTAADATQLMMNNQVREVDTSGWLKSVWVAPGTVMYAEWPEGSGTYWKLAVGVQHGQSTWVRLP